METEIKEEKSVVLKRVPPGDRWSIVSDSLNVIHPSLTAGLDAWFQLAGNTSFFIDAKAGTVSIVKSVEVERPIEKYSLYGEH